MAKLSGEQVAAAALLGGFPAQAVPTAVAVAYGESTWNTTSSNACCSGLWQIHRKAHADKIRGQDLTNPVVNARIARQVWAGDWCGSRAPNGHCAKWEAYGLNNAGKSWAEKLRMGAVAYAEVQRQLADGKSLEMILGTSTGNNGGLPDLIPDVPGVGELADAAGAIAGTGKAIVDAFNRLGAWISDPNNWLRVAEVIGGGLLIALGLRITFNAQINMIGGKVVRTMVPGGKAGAVAAAKSTVSRKAPR